MPPVDFRTVAFDEGRIAVSGRSIGTRVFPKLYTIENILRSIIHTILSTKVAPGTDWWPTHVGANEQKTAAIRQADYAKKPTHSTPGKHASYYIGMRELSEIIRSNFVVFRPFIPDIDDWVIRMEHLRLPRNVVAHMNWLSKADQGRIEVFRQDLVDLLIRLRATSGLKFSYPPP